MIRVNRLVTIGAGCRDRLLIFVRPMAAHALGARVHHDRRRLTLGLLMATGAVFRRKGRQEPAVPRVDRPAICNLGRGVVGKGVAVHAIGTDTLAQTSSSLLGCVLDVRLSLMARRAAGRRYAADRSCAEHVATTARDASLDDVHTVPGDAAVLGPLRWHVNPPSRGATSRRFRTAPRRRAAENRREQYTHERPTRDGKPARVVHSGPQCRALASIKSGLSLPMRIHSRLQPSKKLPGDLRNTQILRDTRGRGFEGALAGAA